MLAHTSHIFWAQCLVSPIILLSPWSVQDVVFSVVQRPQWVWVCTCAWEQARVWLGHCCAALQHKAQLGHIRLPGGVCFYYVAGWLVWFMWGERTAGLDFKSLSLVQSVELVAHRDLVITVWVVWVVWGQSVCSRNLLVVGALLLVTVSLFFSFVCFACFTVSGDYF